MRKEIEEFERRFLFYFQILGVVGFGIEQKKEDNCSRERLNGGELETRGRRERIKERERDL